MKESYQILCALIPGYLFFENKSFVLPPSPILSDTAIRESDLDEDRAKKSELAAKQAMENSNSDMDLVKAKTELDQAAAQLKLIKKLKGKR